MTEENKSAARQHTKANKIERFQILIDSIKNGKQLNRYDYADSSTGITHSEATYDRDMKELRALAEVMDSPYLKFLDSNIPLYRQTKVPDVTDREYLLLALLHQLGIGIFRQDKNHPALVSIFNTLNHGFDSKNKSPYIELLDHIRYRNSEAPRESDNLSKIMYILQALKKKVILQCEYHKPKSKISKTILLKPDRLFFYNGSWYVIGEEDRSEKVKQYKVSRMDSFDLTDIKYTTNRKKLNKVLSTIDHSFGIHFDMEQETKIARIKFDTEVKDLIQDLIWYEHQENNIKQLDGVIYKIPYTASMELLGRVLRYGSHAEILEPAELREEWLTEISRMAKLFLKQ